MSKYTSALVVAGALVLASGATGQSQEEARTILQQAAHAEMVDGDLARAASLYRQVATSASASRRDVAQALVKLGHTYELQGSPQAEVAYARVVAEFPDQPELFLAANARLNERSAAVSSNTGLASIQPEYKLILPNMATFNPSNVFFRSYDFSPDGAQLVFNARVTSERKKRFPALMRELYVRDTNGSIGRPLIEDAQDWEFLNFPRWSPDGHYIFYRTYKETGTERRLMLFDMRTRQTKEIPTEQFQELNLRGAAWLPDSSGLVLQSRDGFRIIGLGGEVRKFHARELHAMTRMGNVSPDGTQLLYHRAAAGLDDPSQINIWVLNLETGDHTIQFSDRGYEGWPAWGKDGQYIYYVSGPTATRNVFRRKPGSDAPPVKVTAYSNASAIYPLVLPIGGQLTFVLMNDNHVILTTNTDAKDAPRPVVRGANPMLSPNGDTLYYTDSQPGRTGLWKAAIDGGDAQQLVSGSVFTSYGQKTLLSPDGSQIAYAQPNRQPGDDSTSLYVMPSSGGTASKLYTTEGIHYLVPTWSTDGKEIAFAVGGDLMTISANGGDPTLLATVKRWETWSLEWSPDGGSIAAFAYLDDAQANAILIVDRATKKITRIAREDESEYKEILAWHPAGDRISYMHYNTEDGNGSRIASVESGEPEDLVDMPDPMWDYIGIWGPDQRYYFTSVVRGDGLWGLYAYDETNGEYQTIRQLNDRAISLPSWSRDGKRMAWSEQEPVRQLWMMTGHN